MVQQGQESGGKRRLDIVTLGRAGVDLYGEQVGGRLEDMASFAKYIVSRDKEVNNQRNLLIQNHRVAKSVHEILPLKYFGFSITSK